MAKTVVAEFRLKGTPKTGLTPTILIWRVEQTGADVLVVNGSAMTEIDNGFYKFIFNTPGFDPREDYVYQADGGATITNDAERFVSGACCAAEPEVNADATWEADNSVFSDINTMGGRHNATFSNVEQLLLGQIDIEALIDLIRKHATNRTLIDEAAKTLTVFDDDGTTPLEVFDLKDSAGDPSVKEVFERVPR